MVYTVGEMAKLLDIPASTLLLRQNPSVPEVGLRVAADHRVHEKGRNVHP